MAESQVGLKIEGMHCEACVRRVTQALGRIPGVAVEQVEVGEARVAYDDAKTTPQAIAGAIDAIGFSAALLGQ